MSKLPKGLTLVRIDTEIYNQFKEYCDNEAISDMVQMCEKCISESLKGLDVIEVKGEKQ